MSDTLTSHQLVLEQLQLAADKITATSVKLEQQSELVSNHNSDEGAHLYIQQMIQNITAVSPTNLSTAISNHNVSVSAHADIRAAITALSAGTAGIEEHNTSNQAHPDVRNLITALSTEFQVVRDNSENISNLDAVYDSLGIGGGSISGAIQDLQDGLATTDAQVLTNKNDIAALTLVVGQNTTLLGTHSTTLADLSSRLVAAELEVESLKANGGGTLTDGIDLSAMVCDIPMIVAVDQTYTFTIENVPVIDGETLTFDLNPHLSGFVFSKTEGIVLGEEIEVLIPSDAMPGAIKQFTVTAKYAVSEAVNTKVLVTKINSLPVVDNMLIDLPLMIEPNHFYTVKIAGATDVDGQVITYVIDDMGCGLVFSKVDNLAENEEFTVAVPSNAERGHVYTFKITAFDSVGAFRDKEYTGFTVNILPDLSAFTHNMPTLVKPGSTYSVRFNGATSSDGSAITYSVAAPVGSPLTFAKTSGIAHNENVLMFADTNNPQRGTVFPVTITAIDAHGASSEYTANVRINSLPTPNTIYTTMPNNIAGGSSMLMQIYGGDDAERSSLKYNIVGNVGLAFSKMSNILSTDIITVTVPTVAINTTYSFSIEAVDALDEKSATVKVITVLVTNDEATSYTETPQITYPVHGDMEVPATGFTLTLTPYAVVEVQQIVTAAPSIVYPQDGNEEVAPDFDVVMTSYTTELK